MLRYNDDENNNELVSVETFFAIGERAKCNIGDCKSELRTTTTSHLVRHIFHVHPTYFEKIETIPINQLPIPYLRESTLFLAVQHVTIHGRPFSSLNDGSFKLLISERLLRVNKGQDRNKKLTINIPNVQQKVNEVAALVKEEIKNELKDKQLCFMMDIASRYFCSLLGVGVQFIDNGKLKVRTVMMEKILKRHNMKNLTDMFMEMLKKFGVPVANAFTLTTDNGSNMLSTAAELDELAIEESDDWTDIEAAVSMIERENRQDMLSEMASELYGKHKMRPIDFQKVSSIRCGSHTFHLAVKAALNTSTYTDENNEPQKISKLIDKAREVVKELRTTNFLIELDKKKIRHPVKDNVTRWFSSHVMLGSLLRCKTFIQDNQEAAERNLIPRPDVDPVRKMRNVPTDHEWKVIEDVVQIMTPSYLKMKFMQSEAFGLSDFYGAWLFIKCSFHGFENRVGNVTDLEKNMMLKMKSYESELLLNPLLLSAVYLDPRFGLTLKGEEKIVARSKLAEVFKRLNDMQQTEDNNIATVSNTMVSFSEYLNSYARSRNSQAQRTHTDTALFTDEMLALEQDLNDFENEETLPPETDILLFWEKKKNIYPRLYKLVNTIMAVPSTQNTVERYFSSFAFIYDSKRTSLNPDMLQNILLIRNNPNVFEKVMAKQLADVSK